LEEALDLSSDRLLDDGDDDDEILWVETDIRNQAFWNVTLCLWVIVSRRF